MQDPNTPNHSDGERGSGQGSGEERPKLKLKKILTPLSPHLKAPRPERDPRIQKPESYHPSPQAEPVEPEEPVLERPRAEPVPLEEIEPARPEELNPYLPEEGMEAPEEEGDDDYPAEPESEDDREPVEPEEEEEAAPSPPPPRSSKRRVLQFTLGMVMLAAAAFLALRVFTPFGGPPEPVPGANTVRDRSAKPSPGGDTMPGADLQPMDLMVQMEGASAEEYIARLQQEPIFPASEPRGIFIDRVFIPEGSSLNPKLGIRLVEVEFSSRETTIILQDSESNPYKIALNR